MSFKIEDWGSSAQTNVLCAGLFEKKAGKKRNKTQDGFISKKSKGKQLNNKQLKKAVKRGQLTFESIQNEKDMFKSNEKTNKQLKNKLKTLKTNNKNINKKDISTKKDKNNSNNVKKVNKQHKTIEVNSKKKLKNKHKLVKTNDNESVNKKSILTKESANSNNIVNNMKVPQKTIEVKSKKKLKNQQKLVKTNDNKNINKKSTLTKESAHSNNIVNKVNLTQKTTEIKSKKKLKKKQKSSKTKDIYGANQPALMMRELNNNSSVNNMNITDNPTPARPRIPLKIKRKQSKKSKGGVLLIDLPRKEILKRLAYHRKSELEKYNLENKEEASKKMEKKINNLKEIVSSSQPSTSASNDTQLVKKSKKDMSLREKMMDQLKSARFRMLNEEIYTNHGADAMKYFKKNPEEFKVYHEGYRQQVSKWPINPLDVIIKSILKMPKDNVIADLGCGDGTLAKSVPQKVHSFDLLSKAPHIIICDMSKVPLQNEEVDVVVFCLSLMGTNLKEFILEANRILKTGGLMKIAEVESRFETVETFVKGIQLFGFKLAAKNLSHNLFVFMDFKKEGNVKNKNKTPTISLHPCLYKKR